MFPILRESYAEPSVRITIKDGCKGTGLTTEKNYILNGGVNYSEIQIF